MPRSILGISAYYHDSAACLLHDGRLVAAAQEERFSRQKHDPGFPSHAAAYCLKEGGIGVGDLEAIAFYDKPLLKFERLLETYLAFAPRGFEAFRLALPVWSKQKLWIKGLIRERLGYEGRLLFLEHHESHAASAFYPSPFEEAAILTLDGVGEWATASYGVGRGNRIELSAELRFPHSLGMLYSAFTYYLGFRVNSGEYKVMGLAPYGEPRFADAILRELVDLKSDGSFKLDQRYFDYCAGLTMTNARFDGLFGGPPRAPESPLEQRHMDVAASVQKVTEEIMLRMARHVRAATGLQDLCLAGGVALNCVGNGLIHREGVFKRLWVQPAAGDAGGALGAAFAAWHQCLGCPRTVDRRDRQRGSLLGPEVPDEEIEEFLVSAEAGFRRLERAQLVDEVCAALAEGKVVGWFQGRMEFGPRALGARSILGDPRDPGMQSRLNLKIKKRESFRPFAPAVLRERCAEYFELEGESPYMLLVAPVRRERRRPEPARRLFGIERLNQKRSDIPAVTHLDYSARVQTVSREDNPLFHELLEAFRARTGCAVLVNTSFNLRGEPIVCRPREAYACFMRSEMDCLAIGSFFLEKAQQPAWSEDPRWMREPAG